MIKMGVTEFIFKLLVLKAYIKGVLTGYTVVMVTTYGKKITPTCSPMIGNFFHTIIITLTDKEW